MKKGRLEIELETLSHVLIGSGATSERPSIDITLLRRKIEGGVKFCIPGSTLKGLIRKNASRLAHFLQMSSCYNIKDLEPCDICRIFGSQDSESKIFFTDAYSEENIIPLTLTGVTINRKTGAAASGQLYSYEALPPHIHFQFRIDLIDLTPEEIQLVLLALNDMQYQKIGRSAGRIKCRILDMNNMELTAVSKKIMEQCS